MYRDKAADFILKYGCLSDISHRVLFLGSKGRTVFYLKTMININKTKSLVNRKFAYLHNKNRSQSIISISASEVPICFKSVIKSSKFSLFTS